jgi:hypothetical protein
VSDEPDARTAQESCPAELIEKSVSRWVAAADEMDAFDVALSLHRAWNGSGDDLRADLVQARLLLLTGHPDEGLTLLHRQHITDLPREPTASWPDLLLAACRAATGSTDAYRWLRHNRRTEGTLAPVAGRRPSRLVRCPPATRHGRLYLTSVRDSDGPRRTSVRACEATNGVRRQHFFPGLLAKPPPGTCWFLGLTAGPRTMTMHGPFEG